MSINIIRLSKKYHNEYIFKNLNYSFMDNNKYYIKGTNGIGKTTLIKCILNQIEYEGIVKINGIISYCPDNYVFPDGIELYSFIRTFSMLNEEIVDFDKKLDKYLNIFSMSKCKNRFIKDLSKGQKEKVNIILSLITPSDILIMDEPFSGLDNQSVNKLKEELSSINKLVIIVSHLDYLSEEFIELEIKENEIIQLSKS